MGLTNLYWARGHFVYMFIIFEGSISPKGCRRAFVLSQPLEPYTLGVASNGLYVFFMMCSLSGGKE